MRFTQTPDAFYISTLYAPNDTLVLASPVPYVQGDEVTVVGGNASGTVVPSELSGDGRLTLTISEEVRGADEYAWVFKIAYGGVNSSAGGGGGGGNGSGSGSGDGGESGAHALGKSSSLALALPLGLMFLLV